MYKTLAKEDFIRDHLFETDYKINGFLVYGGWEQTRYEEMLRLSLERIGHNTIYKKLDGFLAPILEFTIEDKKYWFVVAYGGALLCEWLHIACLFGSQRNLVIGSCGGLLSEANSGDVVVPTYSFADESTTRAYQPEANNLHYADNNLRKEIIANMGTKYKIWEGPTITYEAMLAETWEDIMVWSKDGYYGVEMEAATVFAVSNYFKVPSAGLVRVADNLIKKETVFDDSFKSTSTTRKQISYDMFDAALKTLIHP